MNKSHLNEHVSYLSVDRNMKTENKLQEKRK